MSNPNHPGRLTVDQVHWQCDPQIFDFETTQQVDPAIEVLGQETARTAIEFGVQCRAPGAKCLCSWCQRNGPYANGCSTAGPSAIDHATEAGLLLRS